jgi:rhamnulokinase
LIKAVDIPRRLLGPIVPSGSRLGILQSALAGQSGLNRVEVIASCSHDTAAAVAAVPANEAGTWAYISSGTWSLMGVEVDEPVITDKCRELNFTNEIGYGGSVRLLKNLIGLWVVQECRRDWAKNGHEFDYATLTRLAAEAPAFTSIINPTDPRLVAPEHMPEKIAAICRETNQTVPSTPGAMVRCVLESLALLYRRTLRQIEELIGKNVERVHIVGGGSQNAFLNQCTANALQIPVLAGPVEATAAGNVLVQAIAVKEIPSLGAGRNLIRESFPLERFTPHASDEWNRAYARFERLLHLRTS